MNLETVEGEVLRALQQYRAIRNTRAAKIAAIDEEFGEPLEQAKTLLESLMYDYVDGGGKQTVRDGEGMVQLRAGRRKVVYAAKRLEALWQGNPIAYSILGDARKVTFDWKALDALREKQEWLEGYRTETRGEPTIVIK